MMLLGCMRYALISVVIWLGLFLQQNPHHYHYCLVGASELLYHEQSLPHNASSTFGGKEKYNALIFVHTPKTGGGSLFWSIFTGSVGRQAERYNMFPEADNMDPRDVFAGNMYSRFHYPRNSVKDKRAQFKISNIEKNSCKLQAPVRDGEMWKIIGEHACTHYAYSLRDELGLRYVGEWFGVSWHYFCTEPERYRVQEEFKIQGTSRMWDYPLFVMGHAPYGMHQYMTPPASGVLNAAYITVFRDPVERAISMMKHIYTRKSPEYYESWNDRAIIRNNSLPEIPPPEAIFNGSMTHRIANFSNYVQLFVDRGMVCNWLTLFLGYDVSMMETVELYDIWHLKGLVKICPDEKVRNKRDGGPWYSSENKKYLRTAMQRVEAKNMHVIFLSRYSESLCVARRRLGIPLMEFESDTSKYEFPPIAPVQMALLREQNGFDKRLVSRALEVYENVHLPQHPMCKGRQPEPFDPEQWIR